MNIGFFTDSYHPYLSGVVNSIDRFKNELERQGHNIYIFAPDYPTAERQEGVYRFLSVPAFVQKDFRLAIPISQKIIPDLKNLKLDIIHTHTPFLMGTLARYVARKLEIPLVFTFHTLYDQYLHYLPLVGGLAGDFLNQYLKAYCKSCDLIIAPSAYVERELVKHRISTPGIVISTGIELAPFKITNKEGLNNLRKGYHIDKQEQILIFVGRLGEEKNPFFLLEAYKRLINNFKIRPWLIIVGDGPEREKMIKFCQKNHLSELVIFAGRLEYKQVVDLYKISDIFVFPSKTETQGLVTLEAMAGGLPVVAVNAAGSTAMVENGIDGLLVPADVDEFTRAIYRVLTDEPIYNKLKENALKKAEEFSIEKMAERLLDAYEWVSSNKGNVKVL